MAENFQAEVCGGNWSWPWNPSKGIFNMSSSPCCSSSSIIHDMASFEWLNSDHQLLETNTKSCTDDSGSPSDGLIVIQDMQISSTRPDSSIDPSLQIMGIGPSSSMNTDHWNQPLIHASGTSEVMNNQSMQQESRNPSMNYQQEIGVDCSQGMQKNWSNIKNFSTILEVPSINSLELLNQDHLKPPTSLENTLQNSSNCQNLSTNFPMSSVSYNYPNLLQTLFETEPQTSQPFYDTSPMNPCPSTENFQPTLNEVSTNISQVSSKISPMNRSAVGLNDFPVAPFPLGPQFFPSLPSYGKRPSLPSVKAMINTDDQVQGLSSVAKKSSCEPTFKRSRIETPTPLPTFKVRKEKLGDRITALQQLVSPFGKTDTASVLHEAIEYIKFLHDQVGVLSTPYMKNGAPPRRLQNSEKAKEEGPKQDLKSRGLCLVPISSTFPVAAETTTDFWIPTFGATFR